MRWCGCAAIIGLGGVGGSARCSRLDDLNAAFDRLAAGESIRQFVEIV
jgi:hypothetical protein